MLCSLWPLDSVQVPAKAQDNMLLRHIPVSRTSSSQEGLSDLVSNPGSRGKNSLSSNEGNTSISIPYFSLETFCVRNTGGKMGISKSLLRSMNCFIL